MSIPADNPLTFSRIEKIKARRIETGCSLREAAAYVKSREDLEESQLSNMEKVIFLKIFELIAEHRPDIKLAHVCSKSSVLASEIMKFFKEIDSR